MPCYHPIPASRHGAGMRLWPKPPDSPTHHIPCGKCLGCRDIHAATWALRLEHESRAHSHNTFLTLTYDGENETNSLSKRDLQLFWKRLRKYYESPIKYFACGEYGDRTKRPHYHAAVFGLEIFQDSTKWDAENSTSETLNNLWGKGRVLQNILTPFRMAYVTGYVLKKAGYKKQLYCDEDGVLLENPFQIPSNGLGKNWVEKYANDLRDGHIQEIDRKIAVPRYYMDRIKKVQPGLADIIQRAKDIRRAALPDPDPARNKAAEKIREQRIKKVRDKI